MNCARACTPEEEKENIERWTLSIANLLMHEQGKTKFRSFLEGRNLEEDLINVTFWEKCSELETFARNFNNSAESEARKDFNAKSKELITFSDNINFDDLQSKEFMKIENNPVGCPEILRRAKSVIHDFLKESYDAFIKNQLGLQS